MFTYLKQNWFLIAEILINKFYKYPVKSLINFFLIFFLNIIGNFFNILILISFFLQTLLI